MTSELDVSVEHLGKKQNRLQEIRYIYNIAKRQRLSILLPSKTRSRVNSRKGIHTDAYQPHIPIPIPASRGPASRVLLVKKGFREKVHVYNDAKARQHKMAILNLFNRFYSKIVGYFVLKDVFGGNCRSLSVN